MKKLFITALLASSIFAFAENPMPADSKIVSLKESSKDSPSTSEKPTQPTETESAEDKLIRMMLEKNPFADFSSSKTDAKETIAEIQAPNGLELRGISCVNGKWTFFIHDSHAKASYRIGLKKTITEKEPYSIDFYDDESKSVVISNSVATYTLTLKTPDAPSGKGISPAPLSGGAKASTPQKTKATTPIRR